MRVRGWLTLKCYGSQAINFGLIQFNRMRQLKVHFEKFVPTQNVTMQKISSSQSHLFFHTFHAGNTKYGMMFCPLPQTIVDRYIYTRSK
jgi:hypothetical protein